MWFIIHYLKKKCKYIFNFFPFLSQNANCSRKFYDLFGQLFCISNEYLYVVTFLSKSLASCVRAHVRSIRSKIVYGRNSKKNVEFKPKKSTVFRQKNHAVFMLFSFLPVCLPMCTKMHSHTLFMHIFA